METGITPGIHDLPPATYHAIPGFSKSWMDLLLDSPATLKDHIDYGIPRESPAMTLGSAVHCAVLEPDEFRERYIQAPDLNKNTTKYRSWAKEQAEAGRAILDADALNWCDAIARRVQNNPTWRRLQEFDHLVEPSLVWERDGLLCKARPDWLSGKLAVMVDLKTTRYGVRGFAREIATRRYYLQAAWYIDGYQRITGEPIDSFLFLAAHKSRPFLISLHELFSESKAFEIATAECSRLFEVYKACMSEDRWPGYPDEPQRVELPEWITAEEADDDDNGNGDETAEW